MKFIYLIQSDSEILSYNIPSSSDYLLLQWQDNFVPTKNSFHFPNSSWAEGRNELFRRAKEKDHYDYFIFLDDDVQLNFELIEFENLLNKYKPKRAVPWCKHTWNILRIDEIDLVKYVDHLTMALRNDCAIDLLPYTTKHDKICWWLSSEDMCEKFYEQWPLETMRFNFLTVENLKNREYPRGRPEYNKILPKNVVKPYIKLGRNLYSSSHPNNIFVNIGKKFMWFETPILCNNAIYNYLKKKIYLECQHNHIILYPIDSYKNYFKFAFVRNPWDRLVSIYNFLNSEDINEQDKKWVENNLKKYKNFNEFIKNWLNRKNVLTYHYFFPQFEFMCVEGIKPVVDFIGYFENFEEDAKFIADKINIHIQLENFKMAQNKEKIEYTRYYTDETAKIVADVYREDIEIFGYEFD